MAYWIVGGLVVATMLYFIGLYTYWVLKITFGGPWGH